MQRSPRHVFGRLADATHELLPLPSHPVPTPGWYTPHRLMAVFCSILFLAYLDMGCFASNGVNGSLEPKTGIQVSDPELPSNAAQAICIGVVLEFFYQQTVCKIGFKTQGYGADLTTLC